MFSAAPASDVLGLSHRLQVVRVHADADATEVVQLETGWYWASVEFVRDAMRNPEPPTVMDVSVSPRVDGCSPEPAAGVRLGHPLRVEALALGHDRTSKKDALPTLDKPERSGL